MVNMTNKDEIKSVAFPTNLLKEIDEFREKNYFKQFSPAILYLVHLGLEYHQKMQYNSTRPFVYSGTSESPFFPATWTIPSGVDYMWYTGYSTDGTTTTNYTGTIAYG